MTDPFDVTEFRFRNDHLHNRDFLEYQAEKAFQAGNLDLAAKFAQAAGLYALTAAVLHLPDSEELGEMLDQFLPRDDV